MRNGPNCRAEVGPRAATGEAQKPVCLIYRYDTGIGTKSDCFGVVLVGNLDITPGALIACVILSGRILSPLVQAGQLLTKVNHALAAYSKVDELMSIKTRDEIA